MDKHIWKFDTEAEYQATNTPPPVVALVDGGMNYDPKPTVIEGYEFIDMGTSVLWSTKNLGASKPEDSGKLYQYACVEGYTKDEALTLDLDWTKYKWSNGSGNSLTKYNNDPARGECDGRDTIELEDDAAFREIGKNARIPSIAECEELYEACEKRYVENYNSSGVNGFVFTSKKYPANKLFFPVGLAASYEHIDDEFTDIFDSWINNHNTVGQVRDFDERDDVNYSYFMFYQFWLFDFNDHVNVHNHIGEDAFDRYNLMTIRPVYLK